MALKGQQTGAKTTQKGSSHRLSSLSSIFRSLANSHQIVKNKKKLPARPETASMLYIALAALTFPLSISVKLKTLATFDSRNTNTTYYHKKTQPSLIISINPITTFPCFKYPFSNPSMSNISVPRNLISFEKKPNYIGFINSKLTLPSVSIQSPISTLLTYL